MALIKIDLLGFFKFYFKPILAHLKLFFQAKNICPTFKNPTKYYVTILSFKKNKNGNP